MAATKLALLAIVGPTGSGKSQAAIGLAQHYGAEIVAADSRTVYRGMDIGTAKPTATDQARVPHHLIDLVEPNELFNAADFQRLATAAVAEIQQRKRLPFLVGGTGLYVDAVLYNYAFPPGSSRALRDELAALPLPDLVERLQRLDPERAAMVDLNNPRRVVRALETLGQPRRAPMTLALGTAIIGIDPGMPQLELQLADRTHRMITQGLVKEVVALTQRYNPVLEAFSGVGYREVLTFFDGEIGQSELEPAITLHSRQLAKRQLTWFRRNADITWVDSPEAAVQLAQKLLG